MRALSSIFIFALGVMLIGAVHAADDKKQSRQEKLTAERVAKLNERYQPTGKMRKCVSYSQIRDTQVLDDQTIFFRATGRRGYVNKMSRKCPRLLSEERFAYRSHTGQLCRGEVISVLDSFGQTWASCSLGEFQEYIRKPKEENGNK